MVIGVIFDSLFPAVCQRAKVPKTSDGNDSDEDNDDNDDKEWLQW